MIQPIQQVRFKAGHIKKILDQLAMRSIVGTRFVQCVQGILAALQISDGLDVGVANGKGFIRELTLDATHARRLDLMGDAVSQRRRGRHDRPATQQRLIGVQLPELARIEFNQRSITPLANINAPAIAPRLYPEQAAIQMHIEQLCLRGTEQLRLRLCAQIQQRHIMHLKGFQPGALLCCQANRFDYWFNWRMTGQ